MLRRTRIVCVSDTHNASPDTGAFRLPKGDVLIHAGDLTKQGTLKELQKAVAWIEKADFEAKIVVAGNHDITLDLPFYAEHGSSFHNQSPQDVSACVSLLRNHPSIIYLEHSAADIFLCSPSGPRTRFRVFGSPQSVKSRTWAFQHEPAEGAALWDQIPLDADITVTHTPPHYHCDEWDGREGCPALREALWRVRPRLAICGHIHAGRGAERVHWDLSVPNVRFKEENVGFWEDPSLGTKKQSLLDLSERGREPLDNDGSHPNRSDGDADVAMGGIGAAPARKLNPTHGMAHVAPVSTVPAEAGGGGSRTAEPQSPGRGQGGESTSGRSDGAALLGRMGRRETCIVNACIMASSYPYKGSGGERYNKPIVVDIDLPVWGSEGR